MASTAIRERRRTLLYRNPAGQPDGADEEQDRQSTRAAKNQTEFVPALLRSASGDFCPLDKDLSWMSG